MWLIEEDITESENAIAALQDELKRLNDILEDKMKTVEQVKRATSKGLDQALKDISSKVAYMSYFHQQFIRLMFWPEWWDREVGVGSFFHLSEVPARRDPSTFARRQS